MGGEGGGSAGWSGAVSPSFPSSLSLSLSLSHFWTLALFFLFLRPNVLSSTTWGGRGEGSETRRGLRRLGPPRPPHPTHPGPPPAPPQPTPPPRPRSNTDRATPDPPRSRTPPPLSLTLARAACAFLSCAFFCLSLGGIVWRAWRVCVAAGAGSCARRRSRGKSTGRSEDFVAPSHNIKKRFPVFNLTHHHHGRLLASLDA